MTKQTYQWDAGTISVQPPEGSPEGCPPCDLQIGVVTVTWGEDEPAPVNRHVAPYDFQNRFTDDELVAIQTSLDPLIIRGRTMLQTITTFVDLDSSETQQLIGYMAQVGLVTPERVAVILG
jgi:hypothetical protein